VQGEIVTQQQLLAHLPLETGQQDLLKPFFKLELVKSARLCAGGHNSFWTPLTPQAVNVGCLWAEQTYMQPTHRTNMKSMTWSNSSILTVL
jgi:hypothetical protein